MIHHLKTYPVYFKRVEKGEKPFEVRKNDRDFQTGDILILEEYNPEAQDYTGKSLEVEVTYVLQGGQFGIEAGYCVMGVRIN